MRIELLRKEADLWKITDELTTLYMAVNHEDSTIESILIIHNGEELRLYKREIKAVKKVLEKGEYRLE